MDDPIEESIGVTMRFAPRYSGDVTVADGDKLNFPNEAGGGVYAVIAKGEARRGYVGESSSFKDRWGNYRGYQEHSSRATDQRVYLAVLEQLDQGSDVDVYVVSECQFVNGEVEESISLSESPGLRKAIEASWDHRLGEQGCSRLERDV